MFKYKLLFPRYNKKKIILRSFKLYENLKNSEKKTFYLTACPNLSLRKGDLKESHGSLQWPVVKRVHENRETQSKVKAAV